MLEAIAQHYVGIICTSLAAAYVSSAGLEKLKAAHWFPWLSKRTDGANKAVGAALAALSTLGISASFSAGTLTITGLDLDAIGQALAAVVGQWLVQEVIYRKTVKAKR